MPIEFNRTRLLARLSRWESEFSVPQHTPQLTRMAGVHDICYTNIEALLREAHRVLQRVCGSAADYSFHKPENKLTLGERIGVLEETEASCRFALLRLRRDIQVPNTLVDAEEFKLLRRLNELRVDHVHEQDDHDVLQVVRLTRRICGLRLFELCRRLEVS